MPEAPPPGAGQRKGAQELSFLADFLGRAGDRADPRAENGDVVMLGHGQAWPEHTTGGSASDDHHHAYFLKKLHSSCVAEAYVGAT
jgi:hypothetical protein